MKGEKKDDDADLEAAATGAEADAASKPSPNKLVPAASGNKSDRTAERNDADAAAPTPVSTATTARSVHPESARPEVEVEVEVEVEAASRRVETQRFIAVLVGIPLLMLAIALPLTLIGSAGNGQGPAAESAPALSQRWIGTRNGVFYGYTVSVVTRGAVPIASSEPLGFGEIIRLADNRGSIVVQSSSATITPESVLAGNARARRIGPVQILIPDGDFSSGYAWVGPQTASVQVSGENARPISSQLTRTLKYRPPAVE